MEFRKQRHCCFQGQSILLIARAGEILTYPQYGQSDDDYPKNILTLIVKGHPSVVFP
jgi:hypothetical protein